MSCYPPLTPNLIKALKDLAGPGQLPPCPAPPAHWSETHRDTIIAALKHHRDETLSTADYLAAVAALKAMGASNE